MTTGTDALRRLSELRLCELVGVSQPYRQSLVKRKILDPPPKAGCTATDAVELATIERLARHLTPSELAVAWKELRPLMRDMVPKGRFDVVFDRELGLAVIVRDDAALRAAVITGRVVRVIELGPRLQEVLDGFRRWAEAPPSTAPRQRRTRPNSQAG